MKTLESFRISFKKWWQHDSRKRLSNMKIGRLWGGMFSTTSGHHQWQWVRRPLRSHRGTCTSTRASWESVRVLTDGWSYPSLHPRNPTAWYPKWWGLEKVDSSLKYGQFLVSMLDFWHVDIQKLRWRYPVRSCCHLFLTTYYLVSNLHRNERSRSCHMNLKFICSSLYRGAVSKHACMLTFCRWQTNE